MDQRVSEVAFLNSLTKPMFRELTMAAIISASHLRNNKYHCKASATISNISCVVFPEFFTSFAIDCHIAEWCGSAAIHCFMTTFRCSCCGGEETLSGCTTI